VTTGPILSRQLAHPNPLPSPFVVAGFHRSVRASTSAAIIRERIKPRIKMRGF
jgi:hypothetical protein